MPFPVSTAAIAPPQAFAEVSVQGVGLNYLRRRWLFTVSPGAPTRISLRAEIADETPPAAPPKSAVLVFESATCLAVTTAALRLDEVARRGVHPPSPPAPTDGVVTTARLGSATAGLRHPVLLSDDVGGELTHWWFTTDAALRDCASATR